MRNPLNMSNVNLESNNGRAQYRRRQRQFLEKMIGLDVNFIITAVENDGDQTYALGSRAEANKVIQRMAFGGESPRYKEGDMVDATIISVADNSLALCLGGVDAVIGKFAVTNRYLQSLKSYYKVGDKIRLRIDSVSTDGDNIEIRVNPKAAELEESLKRYGMLKVGTAVLGTITLIYRVQGTNRINIYAWLEGWDLPCRVVNIAATEFGRAPVQGDTLRLTVIGYGSHGYVLCRCNGNYGNSSLFNRG